jgi:hypothetical protein
MAKLLIPIIIFHVALVPIAVAAAVAAPPAVTVDDDRSSPTSRLTPEAPSPTGAARRSFAAGA